MQKFDVNRHVAAAIQLPLMPLSNDPIDRKEAIFGPFAARGAALALEPPIGTIANLSKAWEVHLNLTYRWFCRLGLVGQVLDHSAFSKNRHRHFRQNDLLRRVFETALQRCLREGLVGGDGFAVDASLIRADANRQKGIEGDKGLPANASGRAVEEYLAVLDDAAFGAATEVIPKFVSPADLAARWNRSRAIAASSLGSLSAESRRRPSSRSRAASHGCASRAA
jgi:hypothetical protein